MSFSGKEESGVISWQSSNSSAGIPIKKRKIPLFRPLSPPPQEPSCLPVKDDLVENKSSSPSYESSFLNASVGTSSLRNSDASKNSVLEIKKETPADTTVNLMGNVDLPKGKPQVPSPTSHSDSLDNVDSKEKLLLSVQQKMTGITKLDSAPNEAPVAHAKKEVPYKLHVGTECTSEPGTVELSLGPFVPELVAGQSSDSFNQMPDKLDPSSLCLSLSQDRCVGGCKNGDVKLNSAGTHVHASRSNWDLNTTMDIWEGPAGDGAGLEIVGVSGLKKVGGTNGIEPVISSAAVLGTASDAGIGMNDRMLNFSMLSLPSTEQYKSEHSLHLSLGTFVRPNLSGEHFTSSAKVDSGTVIPNSNLVEGLVSAGSMNSVGCATVKSEPVDENAEHECLGASCNAMGLSDIANREIVEWCGVKAFNSANVSPEKLIEPRSMKYEPVQEGNQETQVIPHKSIGEVVQCQDDVSSVLAMTLIPSNSCSVLSMGGDAPNQFEHSSNREEVNIDTNATQGTCTLVDQAVADLDVASRGHVSKECEDAMDYVPLDSLRNSEGSESDEEKMNISADILEEDSYGSDYEANCNHDIDVCMNLEGRHDGQYEDGEVREAPLHMVAEGPMEDREEGKIIQGDCDGRISNALDFPGDGPDGSAARGLNKNYDKVEDHGEISDDHIKEGTDQAIDGDGSLQESSTVERAAAGADKKMPIKATQKRSLDLSLRNDVQKGHDTEELSDGATNGGQYIETTVSQITNTNNKGTNTMEEVDPTLLKTESSVTVKQDANDGNSGGSRSRIINLPRASNVTSTCKSRFISDRTLVSTERERYADSEGEKVHLRRNRGDWYADGSRKFDRDRFQDQPFRSCRMNFVRGRGRGFRQRGEWDSDQNFGTEIYNGRGDYRFPRYKRASDGGDAELEGNDYGMAPSRTLGMGRGARRPMSDELPSFRHPCSRRLSPGVRDGTGPRGIQMLRRFSGNVSPSRCNGEDVSDLVGPRHGGKFMRGLPEDVIDPIFSRPQPTYQGLDGQFGRGNRNFSTVHRRGLPRIRSKSPVRSRTRSPGPWSSPRRRSPDGFSGLPELTHRRSPTAYRMERIKSPDRPCFAEERVARRHLSPPYMGRTSNDLRDMDSGRLGQPRSANSNRSLSGRILPRSTRRFDTLDPRERTINDDYFGGPIRSGRFHEAGSDGRGDERRKCGDRSGLVRSLRSPFNGADGENLHFHPEEGSRPLRFCQRGDSEFIQRDNLRSREFDRQIKNRPGIALTRMRSLEEEEGNCSRGGQVWHDDGFDDVSQMKRRRF